jgi:DNA-binding SARP family transcriptional activator
VGPAKHQRLCELDLCDSERVWPVRVYTLGRFSVVVQGEPLRFARKPQKRPLELLKAVVAKGGRGIARGDLGAELWPELEGDASRRALDLALHRLRKLLRTENALRVQDGKLELSGRDVWVDAWVFERLIGAIGRLEAAAGLETHHQASSLMERVFRLYTGHFLLGEDAPWAILPRERLRSKLVRGVSMLGHRMARQQLLDARISLYLRAVELEPLAEELHLRLMESYQALGRTAEALDAYRRCRDILLSQLAVGPSAATRKLYRSIRNPSR